MKKLLFALVINLIVLTGFTQTYDEVYAESCGLRLVEKDNVFGFINKQNKLVIPLEYEGAFMFDETYKICGVSKNKKRGYINMKNEVVIPLKYNRVEELSSSGSVIVKLGDKYGLYNYKGELLAKIEYDLLQNSEKKVGFVYFKRNGKTGYLDKNGKEPISNKKEVSFNAKYDKVYVSWSNGMKVVALNKKEGVIDKNGKIVIPIIYDDIFKPQSNGVVIVKKNGKHGIYNMNGEKISDLKYSTIYAYNEKGLAKFERGEIKGFVDKNGKESNVKYPEDKSYETFGGLTKVRKKGFYGYTNSSDKEIIPTIYDFVEGFTNKYNVIRVKKGAYIGVLNKENKVIIPIEYDKISVISDAGIFQVEKNGKTGSIDYTGKTTTKFTSDPTFAKLVKYKSGEKWGFKNEDGNVIIKPQYENVSDFEKQLGYDDKFYARAIKNGKWGLINKKNETILAFNYDKIWTFDNDIAVVEKDSRVGYYKAGKGFITKIKFYDADSFFGNELAKISMEKQGNITYGYINKKGEEIIPPIYSKVRVCKEGYILATFSKYNNIVVFNATTPNQKYAIYNSNGEQDVNLVLDDLRYSENDGDKNYGKYTFKINGKSGEISQTSINQKKLSSIAKIANTDYGLNGVTTYNNNFIYIYNNTIETKRVHFNESEFASFRAETDTKYRDLQFGELLIIDCKKWREVYVSKGAISQSKKVISKGYKSNCGKVILIGNFLPDYTEKVESKTYKNK